MPATHKLNAKKDAWFLEMHLRDPLSGQSFQAGDTVILCSVCHTAHHQSTWGINPEFPCALDCRNAKPLHFRRFSRSIFRQKSVQHKRFRIKKQRYPLLERLKDLDAVPIQIAASLLIPLLVFLQLFLFVPQKLGINKRQIVFEVLYYADAALDKVYQTASANSNIYSVQSRAESAVPMLFWKAGTALSHFKEPADKAANAVPMLSWKAGMALSHFKEPADKVANAVPMLFWKAGMALSHFKEPAGKVANAIPALLWKVKTAAHLGRLPDKAEKVAPTL